MKIYCLKFHLVWRWKSIPIRLSFLGSPNMKDNLARTLFLQCVRVVCTRRDKFNKINSLPKKKIRKRKKFKRVKVQHKLISIETKNICCKLYLSSKWFKIYITIYFKRKYNVSFIYSGHNARYETGKKNQLFL